MDLDLGSGSVWYLGTAAAVLALWSRTEDPSEKVSILAACLLCSYLLYTSLQQESEADPKDPTSPPISSSAKQVQLVTEDGNVLTSTLEKKGGDGFRVVDSNSSRETKEEEREQRRGADVGNVLSLKGGQEERVFHHPKDYDSVIQKEKEKRGRQPLQMSSEARKGVLDTMYMELETKSFKHDLFSPVVGKGVCG